MSTTVPALLPSVYPERAPDASGRVSRDGVLASLDNPDRVLRDARSPAE